MNNTPLFTNVDNFNLVKKRLNNFIKGYRQNIAILGINEDNIGSMLEFIVSYLRTFPSNSDIVCVYISLKGSDNVVFFKNIIFSLLTAITGYINISLDELINAANEKIPSTVDKIKEILKKERKISLNDCLYILKCFSKESGRRCLIIIEEFTDLSRIFNDFSEFLPDFIMLQNKDMFILASTKVKEAEKVLSTSLNLLFGNFERIYLSPISFSQGYVYLKEKLAYLSLSDFFITFLTNLLETQGDYYPIFVKALDRLDYSGNETELLLNMMKINLLRYGSYFNQKFRYMIESIENKIKDFPFNMQILISISRGYIRKKELVSLNLSSTTHLTNKLNLLCDYNILERNGNVFRIRDNLFSFWLQHVFYPRYLYPAISEADLEKIFMSNTLNYINLFKEEIFKDTLKRIQELLFLFDNDTIEVGETKINLPMIRKSKNIFNDRRCINYLIGEGRGIVFMGIKEFFTDDADLVEFIEKSSLIKNKHTRRIFIPINDISSTAKFIAQEYKVPVWGKEELNRIFKIYNRPILKIKYENSGNI